MDPLEKRISALQDALQKVEQPDRQAIWNSISRPVVVKKHWIKQRWWIWVALAAVFLIIGARLGYWWSQTASAPPEDLALEALSPELQAEVHQYERLVSTKEQVLRVNLPKGAALTADLDELELLDSLHAQFLSDFPALPKDERSAQRYLHYYEQKIRILELLLKEIQLQKNEQERNAQRQQ